MLTEPSAHTWGGNGLRVHLSSENGESELLRNAVNTSLIGPRCRRSPHQTSRVKMDFADPHNPLSLWTTPTKENTATVCRHWTTWHHTRRSHKNQRTALGSPLATHSHDGCDESAQDTRNTWRTPPHPCCTCCRLQIFGLLRVVRLRAGCDMDTTAIQGGDPSQSQAPA